MRLFTSTIVLLFAVSAIYASPVDFSRPQSLSAISVERRKPGPTLGNRAEHPSFTKPDGSKHPDSVKSEKRLFDHALGTEFQQHVPDRNPEVHTIKRLLENAVQIAGGEQDPVLRPRSEYKRTSIIVRKFIVRKEDAKLDRKQLLMKMRHLALKCALITWFYSNPVYYIVVKDDSYRSATELKKLLPEADLESARVSTSAIIELVHNERIIIDTDPKDFVYKIPKRQSDPIHAFWV